MAAKVRLSIVDGPYGAGYLGLHDNHGGRVPRASPGRVRRLAAPRGVRRDGRSRLQRRAHRRGGRRRWLREDNRADRPRRSGRGCLLDGTGEYTSVASQAELTHAELARERRELLAHPQEEQAELAAIYRARGLDADLAEQVAAQLSRSPEQAWRIHAREEMGIDPDDLPSPWVAAGSSFAAFALGALVPLLPFLLGFGSLPVMLVLTGLALFGAGAAVARMTAVPSWFGGLRQLGLAAGAAVVSYGLGSLLGAHLG